MDKYKVVGMQKRKVPVVVLHKNGYKLYLEDYIGMSKDVAIGDTFNIINDKQYIHAAYIVNSRLYLPSLPLMACDSDKRRLLKDIPGIRDGSLDALRFRVALARAVRARGMKPCVRAKCNLEKFVADEITKGR